MIQALGTWRWNWKTGGVAITIENMLMKMVLSKDA
jgi:hypothetical protein